MEEVRQRRGFSKKVTINAGSLSCIKRFSFLWIIQNILTIVKN
jgi:hypothetical protein